MQFNDTQDDEHVDRRTVELIEKILDTEKPDVVLINGDVITGGCETRLAGETGDQQRRLADGEPGHSVGGHYDNYDEDSLPQSGGGRRRRCSTSIAATTTT